METQTQTQYDNDAEKYPIDIDSLQKGDKFSPVELVKITGKQPGTDEYDFAVMNFKAWIEREMDLLDRPVTVRISRGWLCVLTDNEASQYNDKMVKLSVRMMRKRHRKNMQVDCRNLTNDEMKDHERRVLTSGSYIAAIHGVGKKVKAIANKRSTPGRIVGG